MMGPMSGLMFLVGLLMFFVGRDRNNDELFSGWHLRNLFDTPEFNRIRFMIIGILLIIAAAAMWVYMLIFGDPDPPPDYSSLTERFSSQ